MAENEIPDDEYERAYEYAAARIDAGADPSEVIAGLLWSASIWSAVLNRQAIYAKAMAFLNEAETKDAEAVKARIAHPKGSSDEH